MAADLHQACLSELGHEAFPRGTMTSGHAARGHPGNKGAGHWALWGWQWKQRNAVPVLEPHIVTLQVFRGMWVPLGRRRAGGTEGSDCFRRPNTYPDQSQLLILEFGVCTVVQTSHPQVRRTKVSPVLHT